MKVALVCCGRLENRYAEEFIEHYKQLGVDHIFIIDNNYDGEEYFNNVLQSYIDEKYVTILDYRNKERIQTYAYQECYNTYGKEYDYMMFFDFDEFLFLNKHTSIKEYLMNNTEEYDVICINCKIYTDNDLIYYDNRPCLERFIEPTDDNFNLNKYVKSIVKTGIPNIGWFYSHIPHSDFKTNTIKYCNNEFKEIFFKSIDNMETDYTDEYAYIKHFMTKTVEEFLIKLHKGGGIMFKDIINSFRIDSFFKINKRTPNKEQILNNYINKNL